MEGVATVGIVRNVVSKRDISIHNIQRNINFGKSKMADVDMVCSIRDDVDLIVRADSSTLKLSLVAKNIKVRYTKPKGLWSPTWRLTFESSSPAR